jgi:hypothetical protein
MVQLRDFEKQIFGAQTQAPEPSLNNNPEGVITAIEIKADNQNTDKEHTSTSGEEKGGADL